MNTLKFLLCLLSIITFTQCIAPPKDDVVKEVVYDLSNPDLQKLYEFQDQRRIDSLLQYFAHDDPTFRYAAAIAFGSIKDEKALSPLSTLLRDTSQEVRVAAAYAIGQIGSPRGEQLLVKGFERLDSLRKYSRCNGAILEAIGKCGSLESLKSMATTAPYAITDTLELEGKAYGIYRFTLRGITAEEGTAKMMNFVSKTVPKYPQSIRLIAANYLARSKDIRLDTFATVIANTFVKEKNKDIRMALAIALGKTKTPGALDILLNEFSKEKNTWVKCNIISGLGNFDYPRTKDIMLATLFDKNEHVAQKAAQFFVDHGTVGEASNYWRTARDTNLLMPTKLLLYKAANKHLYTAAVNTRQAINRDLKTAFESTDSDYYKSMIFDALSPYSPNYRYVWEQARLSKTPVVKTSAVMALGEICRSPNFKRFFGELHRYRKREISTYLVEAIKSQDAGMIAEAAKILADSDLQFNAMIDSTNFLETAQQNLELPKEVETFDELQKTINFFKGVTTKFKSTKPKYNHPIDWETLVGVNDNTRGKIATNKGNIILRFLPDAAPGSVANFIKLAKRGFYDDKFFHRVVPNFVVQGGDPRGDGYGSLDYSIRSELPPLNYNKGGVVGMASAGNDTEGVQWFITHSPTPHLDGRYTIFAEVIEGMDVVDQIVMGDKIKTIIVTN